MDISVSYLLAALAIKHVCVHFFLGWTVTLKDAMLILLNGKNIGNLTFAFCEPSDMHQCNSPPTLSPTLSPALSLHFSSSLCACGLSMLMMNLFMSAEHWFPPSGNSRSLSPPPSVSPSLSLYSLLALFHQSPIHHYCKLYPIAQMRKPECLHLKKDKNCYNFFKYIMFIWKIQQTEM